MPNHGQPGLFQSGRLILAKKPRPHIAVSLETILQQLLQPITATACAHDRIECGVGYVKTDDQITASWGTLSRAQPIYLAGHDLGRLAPHVACRSLVAVRHPRRTTQDSAPMAARAQDLHLRCPRPGQGQCLLVVPR